MEPRKKKGGFDKNKTATLKWEFEIRKKKMEQNVNSMFSIPTTDGLGRFEISANEMKTMWNECTVHQTINKRQQYQNKQ